ncbi:trans-aconitate 2-methyltransferase [Streptomyces sp. NBC_00554]|uniref:trans-aconitate 2-methyltransferase n=1 Tax=unclassified Streptomyces TaxID=2593676 RepID=UPI00225233A3|nr:trans-aconitate 2-methyltransferase [Streptomyces sp. NBC_00620]MCX4973812.1 trans-aconitate 2-methyltransferase [Streptomyces sp. NBC_00620]WUC51658.1 trans-aconitate 2-methyltransferase [Streptomyces sp. NBC_00554]
MPATTPTWDPSQYLRHADHRARPFADLLARVPALPRDPARIADLGCGPGNVTALLAERWPAAHITGYDNSPEMLARAEPLAGPTSGGGRLDFAPGDARTWTPSDPYDLIISNATLQWVPGHTDSFPAWVRGLAPGGTFAFQVPGNFDAPSHRLMRELAHSARWKDRLADALRHDDAVHTPAAYLGHLTALGCETDVWETTYLHLLDGEDPVLDWVKGTGLRPVLTELGADAGAFVDEYRAALREAYPATEHGTMFPFRRIFAVARRAA